MHYISHLAAEVMYLHNRYETEINESGGEIFGEDAMQYSLLLRFESQIIQPLRYNLTTAAYDIINRSNYGRDGPTTINSNDISILYFLFELYSHSISVAGIDPPTFEKSLQYRAQFEDYQYQCLFLYNDLHERIDHRRQSTSHTAIQDMLNQLGPSELARILKNVYPFPDKNDETVLHNIVRITGIDNVVIQLISHFPEFWFSQNWQGLTPMVMIWRCKFDLNTLFQIASKIPEFFALLVRN